MDKEQGFDGLYTDLTNRVIACAIEVHKTLGPGFVESVYENALAIELQSENIPFCRQKHVKLMYAGQLVATHRLDMLIEDKVIVELKAKDDICEADKATTLSYLRATKKQLALIINFGKPRIDIKRMGTNGIAI